MPKDTDTLDEETLETEDLDNLEPDDELEPESDEDTPDDSAKWESRYKDLQSGYTKSQQTVKALEQRLSELNGKIDGFALASTKQEIDWLDDAGDEDDPDEYWRSDPAVARKAMKKQRQEIVALLEQRDAYLLGEIRKAKPVDADIKAKIEELKDDPDFEGMDTQTLSVFAKKMLGNRKVVHRPAGSPGGGKKNKSNNAAKIEDSELFKKMYPEGSI